MNVSREDIYAALFEKLVETPLLKTTSRRLLHWDDVPASEQPAGFQAQVSETPQTVTGQPTRWILRVNWYLYVHAETHGPGEPSTAINKLLDYVNSVLDPKFPGVQGVQTLGGLVHYCRIGGTIETDEGKLGEQSMLIIPIEILAL